ncbi:iron-sulfur protein, partial [Streptomyces sp. TRM76130]|nr:iron-sulfur protein [Streptomyces sp. TRM76130]
PRSSVADAYVRLSEALPSFAAAEPPPGDPLPDGGGWVTAAALAEGGAALEAFLAHDEAQVVRDYGQRARPDVVATFGLHRYAWPACLLITAPWFLHRRVPR